MTLAWACAIADHAFAGDQAPPIPPMPPIVRQMANAYLDDDQAIDVSLNREASVQAYSMGFLMGFTSGGLRISPTKGIVPTAAAAGAAFFRDHPEQLDEIMTGYGYVRRVATGVCSFGFETSRFEADDAPLNELRIKETWWLSGLGKVHSTLPSTSARTPMSDSARRCSVAGYLSPRGRYGHMGGYDRDFKATAIAPADAKSASSTLP